MSTPVFQIVSDRRGKFVRRGGSDVKLASPCHVTPAFHPAPVTAASGDRSLAPDGAQRSRDREGEINTQRTPRTILSATLVLTTSALPPGGRTAWSSRVTVSGQTVAARFWYDGKNLNNAKEDAAEMALSCIQASAAAQHGSSSTSSPSSSRNAW